MASLLVVQIVILFGIFTICLLSVLLPLKLIPRQVQDISEKSRCILSLSNCFSAGVFLGTCFVQLIPFIESKLDSVFYNYGISLKYSCPVTQVLVMLGFFLILIIEQMVKVCQSASQRKIHHRDTAQLVQVSVDSNSTRSDMDSDDSDDGSESKHILKRKKLKKSRKSEGVHSAEPALPLSMEEPTGGATEVGDCHSHIEDQDHGDCSETISVDKAVPLHGHSHAEGCGHSHFVDILKKDFGLRCMLLMLALSMHSFFEGIALGLQDDLYKTLTLFIGVALHEVLVSFAMGVNLAQQGLKLATNIKLCVFYSSTIPIGMAIGMSLRVFKSLVAQLINAMIQGIAAGTFVYVTFLELLPAEVNIPKHSLLKIGFIFLGFVFMVCLKFGIKDEDHDEVYYQPKPLNGG